MPPRLLGNLSSARSYPADTQNLTPRTPHSRAGRAEEALTELELDEFGDEEYRSYTVAQQQSEPLLASSASASFPPSGLRARGDDEDIKDPVRKRAIERSLIWIMQNIGLVLGSMLAVVLFLLVIVSYKRPEALLKVIGDSTVEASGSAAPSQSAKQDEVIPSTSSPISISHPAMHNDSIISYENYTHFPLLPTEYRTECWKIPMHHDYFWSGHKDVIHHDIENPSKLPEGERTQICSRTITYMLDGHVGLLADLALMAQVAAMAREVGCLTDSMYFTVYSLLHTCTITTHQRNATFLVDDTYWDRGNWTDFFQDVRARQPGPEPGCRAPPPEELVACPRSARHWLLNSRTAKFHLGHAFSENYENPYARQLNRLKPIYERSRISITKTIRPNAAVAALIRSARTEFASHLPSPLPSIPASINSSDGSPPLPDPGQYIGVHIRRGDRTGLSWKYVDKHLPTKVYADALNASWARLFKVNGTSSNTTETPSPRVYLASDDPTALKELVPLLPENTTAFTLANSSDPALREIASPEAYVQAEFNRLDLEERQRRTRGMIVDFALLSGLWAWNNDPVPAGMICGMASSVCRLSAVGLGWDRAFGFGFKKHDEGDIDEEHKRWIEIDEAGVVDPVWQAFEMF
ncbi:hypothetical protein EVG20_g3728 [Dentipellis fragilis]|uniref:Uncharacterized protein n=1 Tax=Dentipellis fragilis TaxID=205917 RepID=A0A4Y9Z275_9AGAM|nr:hypothetical protein EVG20_g3728 [Dentipellis fragilis]